MSEITLSQAIDPELRRHCRALKLSPMLDTLPERFALARQRGMTHQDFLTLVLGDEVQRRAHKSADDRAKKGQLDPRMRLERWDETAQVTFDHQLWNELVSLRFLGSKHHVFILGPVGVGKTFMANALGHIACRRGTTVMAWRTDRLLKHLKASRLDNSYERELRKVTGVELLILDDFCLDQLDAMESRDVYELIYDRHQRGSMVITSNREPAEWLAMMADPLRAQSAIDRLQNAAYELVVEGESYRKRQRPSVVNLTSGGVG
jgi:DNA replication protein DnaC